MGGYKALRYFAYTIEILVVFMLEQTPELLPHVFGERPVLLLPVAVSIAMFEPPVATLAFGTLCGLLLDYGMGSVLGFHAIVLACLCHAIAVLAADLLRTNFLTALLVLAGSTALVFFLQWFFFFVLYGYAYPGYMLAAHYLPRLVYTLAFMPIFYYFNRALFLNIREKA